MSELGPHPERPAGAPPPRVPVPGREAAPPLGGRALLAVLAAAAIGGGAVAGSRIGAGVVACAAAVGAAGRLGLGRELDGWQRAWATLAALLAASAMLRDARWVVLPALAGALLTMSLAVAPGSGWAGVASGLWRVVPRLGSGPRAALAGARLLVPGGDRLAPVLRGAGLAAMLLLVFGGLLASGDAAFEWALGTVLPDAGDFDSLPARVLWGGLALVLAAALASAPRAREPAAGPARRRLAPVEWTPALVALDLLLAAFVAIQASVLFGADDHVLRTAGLTYAEYAREGFAQLGLAAALTLAVVAAALRWARTETRGQRILLRVLLGALCALTLVILASAAHRLDLYQDAFGATRLRLAGGAAIAWLAILIALVAGAVASGRYRLLPRLCVLASGLVAAGFVLADPDRRIAERNVERHLGGRPIDLEYARGLSADAMPALARLPEDVREDTLTRVRRRLAEGDGWAGWNAARARARGELRDLPDPPP